MALLAVVVILSLAAAPAARADAVGVSIFVNTSYSQTNGNAPTTPFGYFFSAGGSFASPGDFDSASLTYPGPGSPQNLPITGTTFSFSSSFIPSAATFQTDYPFGTYTITANNSITNFSHSGVINYTSNAYTSVIPALSAATFNGFNGFDPSTAFNVAFNSFTANPSANQAFSFFTVYDGATGNIVFTDGFLSPSTTSLVLPANTLLPNKLYKFELNFDNRIEGFDSTNNLFTEQGFDLRTDGSFTTGAVAPVPEPSSLLLLGTGLLGLIVVGRRTLWSPHARRNPAQLSSC